MDGAGCRTGATWRTGDSATTASWVAASDTVAGGTVIQTMQAGYELFGRTVRPAMVVVAAKGSGAAASNPYASAPASGQAFDGKA